MKCQRVGGAHLRTKVIKKPTRWVGDDDPGVVINPKHSLRVPIQPAHYEFLAKLQNEEFVVAPNTWAVGGVGKTLRRLNTSEKQCTLKAV